MAEEVGGQWSACLRWEVERVMAATRSAVAAEEREVGEGGDAGGGNGDGSGGGASGGGAGGGMGGGEE